MAEAMNDRQGRMQQVLDLGARARDVAYRLLYAGRLLEIVVVHVVFLYVVWKIFGVSLETASAVPLAALSYGWWIHRTAKKSVGRQFGSEYDLALDRLE